MSMILLDVVLHLDTQITWLIQEYGTWIYALLFLIIFAETGLVVMPFLPGDSLLFVAGVLCHMGKMNLAVLLPALILAAFLGDNVNYWVGRLVGGKLLQRGNSRIFKREYIDKTNAFFARHGGKTILFARFLPIVRTFAPFVAGVGRMRYQLFLVFSALGSLAWISC
ncbi:MAG: VTT domain-containing protein, partial [Gallionellaceae bacterium]|nr:VTT domain-containing protein [Gallionellaceae bacterium]